MLVGKGAPAEVSVGSRWTPCSNVLVTVWRGGDDTSDRCSLASICGFNGKGVSSKTNVKCQSLGAIPPVFPMICKHLMLCVKSFLLTTHFFSSVYPTRVNLFQVLLQLCVNLY